MNGSVLYATTLWKIDSAMPSTSTCIPRFVMSSALLVIVSCSSPFSERLIG